MSGLAPGLVFKVSIIVGDSKLCNILKKHVEFGNYL